MKYINAKFLLPDALVKELQHYIQGGYLYIPTLDIMLQLFYQRVSAAKTMGRSFGLPAGIAAAKLPDSSGTSARRLAGASGRAVLSVYPCHPENHLPKITDGDRDKAVPVFFIQIGSARFGR